MSEVQPDRDHTTQQTFAGAPLDDWLPVIEELTFEQPSEQLWLPGARSGHWFAGATFNLSHNCLDRHLPAAAERIALYWEGEPGDRVAVSYGELQEQVVALSRALRGMGVGPGDRVGLHLGWLPETVVAMLACARIGAIHMLLPTPLPVEPLADRLAMLDVKVLFTQDGAWRHGAVLPLKSRADDALLAGGGVEHTVVVRRTGMDVAWFEGDRWYHDLVATARPGRGTTTAESVTGEPVALPADHPVSIVSLANKAGSPVSIVHGAATMLAGAIATHRHLAVEGVFWCAADIAWAVSQFHGVFGPLAMGATTVMYEGTLDIPTHERAWEIVARYGVSTMLTSPSVARTMRDWSREFPALSQIPTLRRVITAGEPVEDELAGWLADALGTRPRVDPRPPATGSAEGPDAGTAADDPVEVGDAWGQLELGGIVRVTGLGPETPPMPDSAVDIVDRQGQRLTGDHAGEVVLRRPWAATMVAVEGPAAATPEDHWTRHPGSYATGDLARWGPEGSVIFLGRSDDLVSISGQLVSLREVTDVLSDHPFVAQVEITWRKDAQLGRALVAAVVLSDLVPPEVARDSIAIELMESVREVLGGLARPRAVLLLDRIGDELGKAERAQAYAGLATSDRHLPREVSWSQVLAAAGHER